MVANFSLKNAEDHAAKVSDTGGRMGEEADLERKELLRVLIVEDNPKDKFLLLYELAKMNRPLQINIVNNLSDAEAAFTIHTFDVIFLDIILPDSDSGSKTLALVHKYQTPQNFVVMSGNDDDETTTAFYYVGAEFFIRKRDLEKPSFAAKLGRVVEICQKPPDTQPK